MQHSNFCYNKQRIIVNLIQYLDLQCSLNKICGIKSEIKAKGVEYLLYSTAYKKTREQHHIYNHRSGN